MAAQTPNHPTQRRDSGRLVRAALWVVLAIAGAWFVWHGPVRAMRPDRSGDFALVQAASSAFVTGANPYDADDLDAVYRRTGAGEAFPHWRGSRDLLYPPTTFVVLSPLALLSFEVGRIAWMAINVLCVLVIFESLRRLIGAPWGGNASMLLGAATLAYAPVLTAIGFGQTPLPVVALICAAQAARVSGRRSVSGGLLGVATALKPQMGLVFLAYEAFRLRWRASLVGLAVALGALVVASIRLDSAGVDWVAELRANVQAFTTGGAPGDPTTANPIRYQLIHLKQPLHVLFESRGLVSALSFAFVGALALWYFLVWLRRREDATELLTLSMACPLSLLVVYHRAYDASLLLIPVAWALRELMLTDRSRCRLEAGLVLVFCAAFLLPSGAALHHAESRGWIPQGVAESGPYMFVVQAHQTWALVGLCIVLTLALRKREPVPAAVFRRSEAEIDPSGDL